MLRGEYALFERYSTKNCYHHHAQNSKYSSPHFSGNERQAEIDLWQVQRGMVVQLQEEGLPLCWQCEFCQYFANIKSIIKVIPVIQVAKYNKLYLCGSSMPSDFKLTSKVTWIKQNTIFFLTTLLLSHFQAKTMILKFKSNKSVAKPGFKATVTGVESNNFTSMIFWFYSSRDFTFSSSATG